MPSSKGSFLGALDGAEGTSGMSHDTDGTGCGVELVLGSWMEAVGLKMGP